MNLAMPLFLYGEVVVIDGLVAKVCQKKGLVGDVKQKDWQLVSLFLNCLDLELFSVNNIC
jgi:hypothetical protein